MAADFKVSGSVVSVALFSFMQYDSVSFRPGPHLNVIIGPNGSGKSSIVAGVTLGLGGKPDTLGRAKRVSEFIKTGRDEATTRVELYNDSGSNWIIERRFRYDNKSFWKIDGKQATETKVKQLTSSLHIQVDNLCQVSFPSSRCFPSICYYNASTCPPPVPVPAAGQSARVLQDGPQDPPQQNGGRRRRTGPQGRPPEVGSDSFAFNVAVLW